MCYSLGPKIPTTSTLLDDLSPSLHNSRPTVPIPTVRPFAQFTGQTAKSLNNSRSRPVCSTTLLVLSGVALSPFIQSRVLFCFIQFKGAFSWSDKHRWRMAQFGWSFYLDRKLQQFDNGSMNSLFSGLIPSSTPHIGDRNPEDAFYSNCFRKAANCCLRSAISLFKASTSFSKTETRSPSAELFAICDDASGFPSGSTTSPDKRWA